MNNYNKKTILKTLFFVVLIFVGIIFESVERGLIFIEEFYDFISFVNPYAQVIALAIYIGIFSYWIVTIYNRIMEKSVRFYLIGIGVTIIFWLSIRAIKWGSFKLLIFEDRLFWYFYYIPMALLPLFFFFISLLVGKDENYSINKKWYLLYIPAIILIILAITNDFHKLYFIIDISKHAYGLDYSHNIGYFCFVAYVIILMIMATVNVTKKFRLSSNKKASRIPILVLLVGVVYLLLYVLKPNYGIGHYLDLTLFIGFLVITFLESCIRSRLINSNIGHNVFFAFSDINSQILTKEGEVVYSSENTLPLSLENFNLLKVEKSIEVNENVILNMKELETGYVAWYSDISHIRSLINEFESLNIKLYEEVDLLTLENLQKSEAASLKKLDNLHSVLIREVFPYSEKIKSEILKRENPDIDEMRTLLFETAVTSTYLKRKVNLILLSEIDNFISVEEMALCFKESFQFLEFLGVSCHINLVEHFKMTLEASLLSYDLFQFIIESFHYKIKTIFLTYNLKNGKIIFTVQVAYDYKQENSLDIDFAYEKFSTSIGNLKIADEGDSYYFSLSIQND